MFIVSLSHLYLREWSHKHYTIFAYSKSKFVVGPSNLAIVSSFIINQSQPVLKVAKQKYTSLKAAIKAMKWKFQLPEIQYLKTNSLF